MAERLADSFARSLVGGDMPAVGGSRVLQLRFARDGDGQQGSSPVPEVVYFESGVAAQVCVCCDPSHPNTRTYRSRTSPCCVVAQEVRLPTDASDGDPQLMVAQKAPSELFQFLNTVVRGSFSLPTKPSDQLTGCLFSCHSLVRMWTSTNDTETPCCLRFRGPGLCW